MEYPFLKVGDKVRISEEGYNLLLEHDTILTDRRKLFTVSKVKKVNDDFFFCIDSGMISFKGLVIEELILVDLV